jgi:hypothetical protein
VATQDIFNRTVSSFGGAFTADGTLVTLKGGLSILTQRMQFSYAQSITRLYDITSSNIYYVGGRTQGNCAIDQVIGPTSTVCAFFTAYGDVCSANGRNITLTLTPNCSANSSGLSPGQLGPPSPGSGGQSTFTLSSCVIVQLGVGFAAQDMIIGSNTTLMYAALTCSGN